MEVTLDILRAINAGEEKPTHIMSKSNTTWTQLQEGLGFLAKNKFVKEISNKKKTRKVDKRTKHKYTLTKKGESVLRYFKREFEQAEMLFLSL